MKPVYLQRGILRLAGALVVAGSIFLAACGGSSSSTETAGIGGTGIGVGGTGIVFGKITGFGSVLVNGGTYDIDTSQFNVDGDTGADQGDLELGMVIKLVVETENGALTSKALEVEYDDEIEGPIAPVPGIVVSADPTHKTFEVFGQTVTIDETSTLFEDTSSTPDPNFGFATIAVNDVVEVSGFRVSATEIKATYVEKTDDLNPGVTEVELRGEIDQYMGGSSFEINGTVINFDPTGITTEIDVPGGGISNGVYVEVEGVIEADQSVTADKIEAEDEDFGDDVDDVSLQGIVVVYNGVDDFVIGNQPVDASTAEFKPASLEGMDLLGLNIEVEGEIVNGTLIAEEVEARDGDTKLRATVFGVVNIGNNSFEVTYPVATGPTEVVINVNAQTLFEDETGTPPLTVPFSLDDLLANDFVRIEGQEINGEVVAEVVKRTDGTGEELKLEGAVDTFAIDSSITILGITYAVDPSPGGTVFEGFADSAAFFAALNPLGGDFVEIEDDDVADGIADEVELE